MNRTLTTNEAEGTRTLNLRIDSTFPASKEALILGQKRVLGPIDGNHPVHKGYPGILRGTGSVPQ